MPRLVKRRNYRQAGTTRASAVRWQETRWHDPSTMDLRQAFGLGCYMFRHICGVLQEPGNQWSRLCGGLSWGRERGKILSSTDNLPVPTSRHWNIWCIGPQHQSLPEGSGETGNRGSNGNTLPLPAHLCEGKHSSYYGLRPPALTAFIVQLCFISWYVTVSGKTNLSLKLKKLGFCYPWTQSTLGFVIVPVASQ